MLGRFPDLPFVENVQAVDFGDSSPDRYRRAFRLLLRGLEQKPPGPGAPFEGELRLPQTCSPTQRALVPSESTFLDMLFRQRSKPGRHEINDKHR